MFRVSQTHLSLSSAVECWLQTTKMNVRGAKTEPEGASWCAELVNAIHVVRSRQDVVHVKTELLKRLRKASDWLVSTACPLP